MYLNCHTYFSFRYGTLSIEELFAEAQRCGIKKLALTDINNTSGYIEMLRICNENRTDYDLELALGIEFRIDRGNTLLYVALAENNEGFEEINRYLSYHNTTGDPLLRKAPVFEHAYIIYPFGACQPEELRVNEYIGVRAGELNRIGTSG